MLNVGILKGRWRCLRYGIRLHGIESCDKLWLTCCALHNFLLEVDGLHDQWRNGVKSIYETEMDNSTDLPFALKRLAKPNQERTYNLSKVGYGNDVVRTVNEEINVGTKYNLDQNKVHNVKDLSLHQFRMKLITCFNIAFMHKKIVWPSRIKKPRNI